MTARSSWPIAKTAGRRSRSVVFECLRCFYDLRRGPGNTALCFWRGANNTKSAALRPRLLCPQEIRRQAPKVGWEVVLVPEALCANVVRIGMRLCVPLRGLPAEAPPNRAEPPGLRLARRWHGPDPGQLDGRRPTLCRDPARGMPAAWTRGAAGLHERTRQGGRRPHLLLGPAAATQLAVSE